MNTLGSNHRSVLSPIQNWYRFKEAFTPELVREAIRDNPVPAKVCIDPFAGSGTTALVCQMMGVTCHSYEVNPFLFDLASAKTHDYDLDYVSSRLTALRYELSDNGASSPVLPPWPPTFVEPGRNGRWIFDRVTAERAAQIVALIEREEECRVRQLLRVAIGSLLVPASNVVINGKGRRYRNNWSVRSRGRSDLAELFLAKVDSMIMEMRLFSDRFNGGVNLHHEDVRTIGDFPTFDLSVFSPPYPNSFDYTDVYNLELWVLGYLTSRPDDKRLRSSTMSSHVQLTRDFRAPPDSSETLIATIERLTSPASPLWNRQIPSMIGGYFAEYEILLQRMMKRKATGGRILMVVGNSRYGGVEVNTADILSEITISNGWKIVRNEPLRTMRTSPQQGGQSTLRESLVVIE